ncbi:MAG: hypothetical protein ACI865_003044 [Flavobacteriaceae bacterium]|jgi:hypothetical protein
MKHYLKYAILGSLTLGLAPFSPEPHIWKQIMNLKRGRTMPAMDWFDLFLHGAPWIFLLVVLISMAREKSKKSQ